MRQTRKFSSLLLCGAISFSLLAGCGSVSAGSGSAQQSSAVQAEQPLSIAEQGMFSAGGITRTSDGTFRPEDQWEETGAGQTSHVDHANVLYQVPANETSLPMVFLHGYGQSRMGWMTTPDGREGWSNLFLRKGHSVYLIDETKS